MLTTALASGQEYPHIDSLVQVGKDKSLEYPEESLVSSHAAYRLSLEVNYGWGEMNSVQWISEAYFSLGVYDSAHKYDLLSIDHAREHNDRQEEAIAISAMAAKAAYRGFPDTALHYFTRAEQIYETLNDTFDLCDLYLRKATVFFDLDDLDSAMIYNERALQMATANNKKSFVGYALGNMSLIHKKLKSYEKALELIEESSQIHRVLDDKYSLLSNYNNAGIIYKDLGDFEGALASYQAMKPLADTLNYERAEIAIGINSGIALSKLGRFAEAQQAFERAIPIAEKYDSKMSVSDAQIGLAESLRGQGKFAAARRAIESGLEISAAIGSLINQTDAHAEAKNIFQSMGDLTQAIYHQDQLQILRDSMFQTEKAQQINELQTRYETVRKDSEIAILNKNAELDQSRKRTLWLALALLGLAALATILVISQRRRRDRIVLTKEREVEIERRKIAEIEVQFKQKELTAKALQLARRSEFLQKLEEEIKHFKSSIDVKVGRASDKIARMLHHETVDEDEWEQFSKEFSSIHQDYLDALTAKHGALTASELRLVALLKMNLNSKDIANILRISLEGVKKARYRLRRKLDLNSSVLLQEYLNNFS